MIGEYKIYLDDSSYPMLSKQVFSYFHDIYRAYKRKQKVAMRKIDTKSSKTDVKDKLKDRFWIGFTHPDQMDKTQTNYLNQGFAEISIEILPKTYATQQLNGLGRDAPNQYPVLPEPTGRFEFVRFFYYNVE